MNDYDSRNIPPAASDDTISKLPKLVIKSKNIGKLKFLPHMALSYSQP
jgi:hypothetical protein